MKKTIFFIIVFLSFSNNVFSDMQSDLIGLGMKFIESPSDFFMSLHHDNEDIFPVFADKHFSMRMNLLPAFLPFTAGGLSMKFKIINEQEYIPQIDLVACYGEILALRFIKFGEGSPPVFNTITYGFNFTKSTDDKTRLFIGGKITTLNFNLELPDPIDFDNDGNADLSELNVTAEDKFIFTGIEYHTRENKYIVVQTGYGLETHKIISRIGMLYKVFELGLDIYPESMLVMHPFIGFHIMF